MDLDAVAEALAVAASEIDGLTCDSVVPDAITEPHFYVAEIEIDYDKAYGRGLDEAVVMCRLLCSRADDYSGQRALRAYMAGSGASSVKAALEAARGAPGQPALGGAAADFRVRRMAGHRLYPVGDTSYVGAEWTIHVIGSG